MTIGPDGGDLWIEGKNSGHQVLEKSKPIPTHLMILTSEDKTPANKGIV